LYYLFSLIDTTLFDTYLNSLTMSGRTFSSADAHGGETAVAANTAVVFIDYQNDFTSEGGKLHDAVEPVMLENNMLDNSVEVARFARENGIRVIHAPITLAADGSDNPNKGLGILKGCQGLFTAGTWGAEICDAMKPQEGDLIVSGKKGLDAFPGTDLEDLLKKNNITTIALAGFLTNCCVESTMRTAYEKGYNVITLTNCTAATSSEGHIASTTGTYGMFSSPMSADEFKALFPPVAQF
jgi:nicotinamidase-related amidase